MLIRDATLDDMPGMLTLDLAQRQKFLVEPGSARAP
jgi:hypothetical protein